MPPLGSGRGRPAGFPAGEPPHGVRIECTTLEEPVAAPEPSSAEPGMAVADVPTPALVVDLDRMERNIAAWQAMADRNGTGCGRT